MEKIKREIKAALSDALRAALAYLVFIAIAGVLSGVFVLAGSEIIKEFDLKNQIVYIFSCLPLPFTAYSVFRAFELYDREAQRAFAPEENERYRFKAAMHKLFHTRQLSRSLAVSTLTSAALSLLLPFRLGYASVIGAFYPSLKVTAADARLTIALTVTLPLLITIFLAKTSAHKWWVIARTTEREKILTHPHPRIRLFFEILKIFGIYLAAFLVLPTVIMLAVSFVLVLPLFKSTEIWITLASLLFAIDLVRLAWLLAGRRRLWRRVLKSLSAEGYSIVKVNRPIISVLIGARGANARFERGDERYELKLLAPRRAARAVYLTPDGVAISRRTVSFLFLTLFHLIKEEDFNTEGDGTPLVLFSPVPKHVFAHYGKPGAVIDDGDGSLEFARGESRAPTVYSGHGYKSDLSRGIIRPLSAGDRVGAYKFYTPAAFISAIDNNCLHR